MHPSAWKGNSQELDFQFTEFSEVRQKGFEKYCNWVICCRLGACYRGGVNNAAGLLSPALALSYYARQVPHGRQAHKHKERGGFFTHYSRQSGESL
jgi:hypothetical protein